MKITRVRIEHGDVAARLMATVTWEASNRPPVEIYYEVPAEFASALVEDGNSFLAAAVFPAVEACEQRIVVESYVCPRLIAGLETNLSLFSHWYGGEQRRLTIEAHGNPCDRPRAAASAAGFMTGGIDSLATLRRNRLLFPSSHPESIRDLICLYGINFESDDSPETFGTAIEALSGLAKQSDASLIPVKTNARRELNPDINFFRFKYHAALLAAAAHALSGRVTTAFIGSSHDIPHLMRWGSHPLVDPNFGSGNLRIYHDGVEFSRFEKTKLVANWDVGLQNIRVCPANWPGTNCSRCEKCLRTMLALAALAALDKSRSFDRRLLTEGSVRALNIFGDNQATFYGELIEPLRTVGRPDLADAVRFVLAKYHGETGIRGTLKQLDRRYFHGGLQMLKRSVQANDESASAPRQVIQPRLFQ